MLLTVDTVVLTGVVEIRTAPVSFSAGSGEPWVWGDREQEVQSTSFAYFGDSR